jgi:UDP-N-acetylglucosamine diphosphorylase/glucosamine-1-phosphate N-acetyltransferase
MRLVIIEDQGYTKLLPLTYTRPACRLRCGIVTLWEKIAAAYPSAEVVIHTREYVAPVIGEEIKPVAVSRFDGDAALLVNGRLIAPADLAATIPAQGDDCAYVANRQVVAARVSGNQWAEVARLLAAGPVPDRWADGLKTETVELPVVDYPWDLVTHNGAQIAADFDRMKLAGRIVGEVHPSAILDAKQRIHVAEGAQVHPGAILLAHEGPIFIGPSAKVMAGAVLEGPVAVGRKSSIKMQAKIYEGTSLGEYCKVGGEVEESVFQAYSNKQHDGFLGHAFLGEWINLGADTNNSDLKNNYSTVTVTIDGNPVDSGSLFVGAIIGDHSKTGINTMLNTGTVIGVGCNVYGADFPPKCVPSFCWGGAGGLVEHDLAKCLSTAEKVMRRRDRTLTPAGRAMLETVFKMTADERRASIQSA